MKFDWDLYWGIIRTVFAMLLGIALTVPIIIYLVLKAHWVTNLIIVIFGVPALVILMVEN